MTPLSGLDGAFLHLETPATPMHVASLSLFELPPGYRGDFYARIKRQMAGRLASAPVLHRKLASMPLGFANPVWVEDDQVDLDHHIQHLTLPPPGTPEQLDDCVGHLHSDLLDRSRPLWRIYIIDGLASGQVAYYMKVHHAVLDGQAGVLLAQALFDVAPKPPPVRRATRLPAEHPGLAQLAAAALKHDAAQVMLLLRHLPAVVRTVAGLLGAAGAPPAVGTGTGTGTAKLKTGKAAGGALAQNLAIGPKTPLNVSITGARGFAALSIPLDTLKRLATAHQAKLNDIVLALCSGTLRRYLAQHGGIPKKPLMAAMPISLRAAGNVDYTTQATMSLVNLHTDLADPVQRLLAIRDAAGAMKALASRARGILPTDFPSITTPWLLQGLAALYGRVTQAGALPPIANVVISNVPGPQLPLYAAGAAMRSYLPLSITEHGVGLNITVMSYAGTMGFGFTTARVAVPDAHALTQALDETLTELLAASAPPAKPRKASLPIAAVKTVKPGKSSPRAAAAAPSPPRAVRASTRSARTPPEIHHV